MTELSADAVTAIVKDVLYKDDELHGETPEDAVIVQGLVRKFGFHPGRLTEAKSRIDALLGELPDSFHRNNGGGWSFLNGCMDKHDRQWGEQRDVEALVCLGIGVGSAEWIMRDMAATLPGGVPYFEVHPTSAT